MPVPVSVTTCGLVISESVMVSVTVRTPVVVGAAFTQQLLPGARLPPQLLLSEKFGLQEKPLIVSVVVPTLAIVTC